jgi:hypothetical protein
MMLIVINFIKNSSGDMYLDSTSHLVWGSPATVVKGLRTLTGQGGKDYSTYCTYRYVGPKTVFKGIVQRILIGVDRKLK